MIHYAISDVRFVAHGINLIQKPNNNEILKLIEINTGTTYMYSVCGSFLSVYGYQTELLPLFSPLKTK